MLTALARIIHGGVCSREGLGIGVAAVRPVKCSSDLANLIQYFRSPSRQRHIFAATIKHQARIAAVCCNEVDSGLTLQFPATYPADCLSAVQQQHVDKAHCRGINTHRQERAEIHAADFDIFHPTFAQCMQRSFAGIDNALRSNGAVELC